MFLTPASGSRRWRCGCVGCQCWWMPSLQFRSTERRDSERGGDFGVIVEFSHLQWFCTQGKSLSQRHISIALGSFKKLIFPLLQNLSGCNVSMKLPSWTHVCYISGNVAHAHNAGDGGRLANLNFKICAGSLFLFFAEPKQNCQLLPSPSLFFLN